MRHNAKSDNCVFYPPVLQNLSEACKIPLQQIGIASLAVIASAQSTLGVWRKLDTCKIMNTLFSTAKADLRMHENMKDFIAKLKKFLKVPFLLDFLKTKTVLVYGKRKGVEYEEASTWLLC